MSDLEARLTEALAQAAHGLFASAPAKAKTWDQLSDDIRTKYRQQFAAPLVAGILPIVTPQTVTSRAELSALPEWSVVLVDEVAWQKNDAFRWFEASGTEHWLTSGELISEYATSTFTVIHTPEVQ